MDVVFKFGLIASVARCSILNMMYDAVQALNPYTGWLCGAVVRALDSRWADRGFNSLPLHCRATTLGKLFTPMCLCSPSSIILVPCEGFHVNAPVCGSHLSWGPMNKGVL